MFYESLAVMVVCGCWWDACY